MKKQLTIVVALMMLASVIAGCGSQSGSEPVATESKPVVSESVSPVETPSFNETSTLNLDWFSGSGTDSLFECPWYNTMGLYHDMVYDTLVKMDVDGVTVVPDLAKSWDISEDGKTYTFTLEQNAKWHDGTPFTAEDVAFSFNTAVAIPDSAVLGTYLLGLAGAKDIKDGNATELKGLTIDGNKISICLEAPNNGIMKSVFAQTCILPKHLLQDVDPDLFTKDDFWKKPIGTGRYYINEVSFPDYFTITRNEDYFGVKPQIKNVLFTSHITGGEEAVAADMIAGKLDYVSGQNLTDINTAKNIVANNPDIKLMIIPATYQRLFWFNNVGSSDGKYNDDMQKAEVRQALNLLIDKEAISSFYQEQAVALSTCVNPDFPIYNSDIPLFKRNVEKAKQMLTDAGFDFNRTIRILYYYDEQTTKDIMELVKQNFAEAGVKVEPFLATGDLASIIYKVKNWDMMYAGQNNLNAIDTYQILVPDGGTKDGVLGDTEYRQVFTQLIANYKATTDPAELKEIGDQIQVEAYTYSMIIPIYGLNKIALYNTSKLKLNESIFDMDLYAVRDYKFEEWELLK